MKRKTKFVGIAVAAILAFALAGCGSSGGGDGVSSCKNCGRHSVYALGFCKSCYESFMDYTYD
ncbi:MAG: hypothetical protein MRZ39_03740 [Oscillospiraceae bacterium]|nr:hypothetical protein [Oscillospiraceae bacterium]